MGKIGEKVAKSWKKWLKVAKSGEKWLKVANSGEKWGRVAKSWKKWGKVVKSGEKMASPAASRFRERPPTVDGPHHIRRRPIQRCHQLSPERLTVSAQHRAAAVTRPRGSSPFPCDGPSTLGYD